MSRAAESIIEQLFPSPVWLPQRMDAAQDQVRQVEFAEDDYRAAPFLDQRGLREGMAAALVPWQRVAAAVPGEARRDALWIFHLSHVGSTLISRLLGEFEEVLPLREPRPLIGLTRLPPGERKARIDPVRALVSRTFGPEQRALVKATSGVSEIAAELIGPASEGGRALLLRTSPDRFIAARLALPGREWIERAPRRIERLKVRAPALVEAEAGASPARLAAVSWACEASALEVAAAAIGEQRTRMVDFEAFLANPVDGLHHIVDFFGLAIAGKRVEAVAHGPEMASYSKASGKPFDVAARRELIDDFQASNAHEIGEALDWLGRLAATSPTLAAALAR